jgi:hypothetical protein
MTEKGKGEDFEERVRDIGTWRKKESSEEELNLLIR